MAAKAALVSVSMGVMEPLLSKLTKLLEEGYDKIRGVSKQMKMLRDELSAMSAALRMLADAEQLNPQMKDWRDKLRELAYDIEDCVDGFMARADRSKNDDGGGPTAIRWLFQKFKELMERHEIANEIQELKARAMQVSETHKRYNFTELTSSSSRTSSVDPRLPALYEEIDRLVGIGRPKKHVMELLDLDMEEKKEDKVISIVGCGGLGKTTLADQVYRTVNSMFSSAAFVSVSRTPDIKKILRDIAKEVGIDASTLDDDERQLINKLRRHLRDKRYFVVIDDVWDEKAWEFIKLALPNNDLGSRIITTTRSITVAKRSSSRDRYVYEMEPLSFADSKRLFFKRAFGSENSYYPHLKDVPDNILRKCGGLPLAIITVSSMLTNKYAKAEWDRVQTAIGFTLADKPEAEKMASILSLSYFDIPNHLRTCLLYLSVFPEDYTIEKQNLINRWIAEGFIPEEHGENAYEIGECYFNDLINRSMIQPVDVQYDQAKACRVHDIILDYIKCKAAEENFVTSVDATKHVLHTSECKVRRLCVINCNEEHVTLWANRVLSHVRSVTVFGHHPVQTSLLPFTVLRVLDLGNCRNMKDHHLTSIEKLFYLKNLRLSSNSITKLPEKIGELRYMQTLDVRGTSIKELPSTMAKLQRLARLYVDWKVTFPDGIIGQMHSLEELETYGIQSYKHGSSLREFFKLTKLRSLKIRWDFDWTDGSQGIRQIEDIHSYLGTLLSSCNLNNLHISDKCYWIYPLSLDPWHPAAPCNLRKLCMEECLLCKLPNWMGSLGNLEVLQLGTIVCVRPEDVETLGAIPSLLYLELATAGGTNGRIVIHGNNGFRSLKYFSLFIWACGTALEFEVGSMPKLEHLKLGFYAHTMECLNGAHPSLGIQHLSTLSNVDIKISGYCVCDSDYDPTENMDDDNVRYVARAINSAVKTLPNCPTIRFQTDDHAFCEHFELCMRKLSKQFGGVVANFLQFEEEQTAQSTNGEAKQESALEGPGDSSSIKTIDPTPLKKATCKVRKDMLRADKRITSLRELVSPFGKTDTASVFHETIEYIKFLYSQIDVLRDGGEAAAANGELTGRGLCLVPISSTSAVGIETPPSSWREMLDSSLDGWTLPHGLPLHVSHFGIPDETDEEEEEEQTDEEEEEEQTYEHEDTLKSIGLKRRKTRMKKQQGSK